MNVANRIAIVLAGFGICLSAAGEEVVAVSFLKSTNGWLEYVVPMNRFLSIENHWDPTSRKFPIDLSSLTRKATERVVSRGERWEDVQLTFVDIRQVSRPIADRGNGSTGSTGLLARTVVSLHFEVFANGTVYSPTPIVMLLDGTIAETRFTNRPGS